MTRLADVVDTVLEVPVVPSFTKIGYAARRRLDQWTDLDEYDLTDRVIAITGPTSGLGRVAAEQLAAMGASLVLVARNPEKTERTRRELIEATGNHRIMAALADMGDLQAVREVARQIVERHDRLDVLIHNAGALTADRRTAPDGTESTVASQVIGPFLLTGLLLERLATAGPGRVLTMSSGGMYTAGLTVRSLEMDQESYRGTEQYARAKRAQVTLNEEWAERVGDGGVVFHALHPGWADTPGVEASLPTFRKIVGPLLRDPDEGSDTLVWLAADDGEPCATTGRFWLDRRVRPIHKLRSTRSTDTPERRADLWDFVVDRSGWTGDPAGIVAAVASDRNS